MEVSHITKCFDVFDYNTLLNILKKKIHCKITLKTIRRMLKAGYIEMGNFIENQERGTPLKEVSSVPYYVISSYMNWIASWRSL